MTALVLPQDCPECGAWLQRPTSHTVELYGSGVTGHYQLCHPGTPVPPVVQGGTPLA